MGGARQPRAAAAEAAAAAKEAAAAKAAASLRRMEKRCSDAACRAGVRRHEAVDLKKTSDGRRDARSIALALGAKLFAPSSSSSRARHIAQSGTFICISIY